MSNKDLQNNEYYLPGGLGTVVINGKESEIIKSESNYQNGSLTLTLSPLNDNPVSEIKSIKRFEFTTHKLTPPKLIEDKK